MDIKKLIFKSFLFTIPLILIVLLYVFYDPFKVVGNYESYFISGKPAYVGLNKDYVSTENWLNKHDRYKYDSYIFGNSKSVVYHIDTWKNYINTQTDKCYHFDASQESIYGIEKKLKLLSDSNAVMKNAVITLDIPTISKYDDSEGHLYIKHPVETGKSMASYQLEFFKTFINADFFFTYADFKLSGKVKLYMKNKSLLDDNPLEYDPVTNELQFAAYENLIRTNPDSFYVPRQAKFYRKDTVEIKSVPYITKKEKIDLLVSIKNYLAKNNTNYKIIIHPQYDLVKLSDEDLKFLKDLFGSERVYDFSGLSDFSKNGNNFYDAFHYRPEVADSIMKKIYLPG